MHILGRSSTKKEPVDYKRLRAAYIKNFYPVSKIGMGKSRPGKLPRLNGDKGGYGQSVR